MDINEQLLIIKKGVDVLINEEELKEKLNSGRQLIVKLGLDPSAPDIHLGHTVVLRKAKQLQDLGHKVIIIIGDFTGKIGDPTGKSKTRKPLTDEQVKENAKTYCEQIFKILDKEKTEVRFNSEWLGKMTFEDVIKLAASTTVARMLERDDFNTRFTNKTSIGLHEFFYPLMQGYDSVAIKADIELGGTDQTFNVLMGRQLQKDNEMEQQIALFMPIIEGTDGINKMSKSLNNYIGVNEPSEIMFKKCMEIPDNLIIRYYELLTDVHPNQINEIKKELENGKNPRDVKFELAKTITRLYHSEKEAIAGEQFYIQAFSKKAIPDDIPELTINKDTLVEIIPDIVKNNFIASGGEFRRMLKQNGIQLNGEKINDINTILKNNDVLKIGKKKFVKIKK